ncbi:hypothetical protein BOTBODRAFT_62116 [Botryobasidium botryosum FD-172 SS1]|uniref:Glycoside hydrolase family 105 protein n=1 Tax=Botryobasidium botryosum (strain FD-172 SS1) TaxID=930990 RepID=A0A067MZP4_BOTB1|nr:hypothetical protein BOTBODRAFT_62116 [Botryobasidium botryosum FD-172 SS1]
MILPALFLQLAIFTLAGISAVGAQQPGPGPTPNQVAQVSDVLQQIASQSWELGTETEALLEYDWPALSVFGSSAIPPPFQLNSTLNASNVFAITQRVIQARNGTLMTFISDGAVGDPASLGVAMLLANWTNSTGGNYGEASQQELSFLLNWAPRNKDGAISHRSEQVQLWSDFIYMVPPYLAYYGAMRPYKSLMDAAYLQCKFYRNNLIDKKKRLWKHVVMGSWEDTGFWATGNGWAAMGMLRVIRTFQISPFASQLVSEGNDMISWVEEIVNATYRHQTDDGTFHNYIDQTDTFTDSSATALLAAVVYRLVPLLPRAAAHVPAADKARAAIAANINGDGYLTNVVDPNNFGSQGETSPEGQAFVLMMEAAYRDYVAWNATGFASTRIVVTGKKCQLVKQAPDDSGFTKRTVKKHWRRIFS